MNTFIKYSISVLMLFIVWACGSTDETKAVKAQKSTKKETSDMQSAKKDCILGTESFEQTSSWPREVFDPAEDVPGFIQYAADVSYGHDDLSLLAYMSAKDSSYLLLFVKILGKANKVKVIGAKKISATGKNISFVTSCKSSCEFDYLPLGMYEEMTGGKIRTIKAWTIDRKKKVVIKLNPKNVDCRDAYDARETEYD